MSFTRKIAKYGSNGSVSHCGIGLREPHISYVLESKPQVAWFELLIDNYLKPNGPLLRQIDQVRNHYPMTFHGVGMSLGSAEPLDRDYLQRLSVLINRYEPAWISDHVAFTHINEKYYHDLLPIPYNEVALKHLSQRINQVQDILGIHLVIENVSSYLQYRDSVMSEAEFITELTSITGCQILLDINNVYVNSINHGFDAREYLSLIQNEKIKEIHLGGYDDRGDYLLDAHNSPVSPAVWALYEEFMQVNKHIPTLIEWDNDLPDFKILQRQATQADELAKSLNVTTNVATK